MTNGCGIKRLSAQEGAACRTPLVAFPKETYIRPLPCVLRIRPLPSGFELMGRGSRGLQSASQGGKN